ncbi:primase-helicase zinc-binding domain-containing protein, partial [Providencia stuartii]
MNTIDAAKGQWAKIFAHYGLPPITGRKHFKDKCPLCERKGKFRIDDKNGLGTWICTCGSGTGFQLLEKTQGKSFKVLADEVDILLGNHRENIVPKPQTK